MVVGGAGNVAAEQHQGARAADRQRAGRCREFREVLRVDRHRHAGDLAVEAHEALNIRGYDADRDEIHRIGSLIAEAATGFPIDL